MLTLFVFVEELMSCLLVLCLRGGALVLLTLFVFVVEALVLFTFVCL